MSFSQSSLWYGLKRWIRWRFPNVAPISTEELANWLDRSSGEKPLLLDARKPEEYAVSHLHKAKLVPPQLETLQNWQEISTTTPIVVYCSVGYRSAVLAKRLQAMGYKQVYNLEGSIFAWANQGYPIYQGESKVQQVHPYNLYWGQLLKPELWKENN